VVPDFWGELITAIIGATIFPAGLAGDPPRVTGGCGRAWRP